MAKQRFPVVKVSWIETERGWGIRPDGCSLHLSKEDAKKYIDDYWASMPDEVPCEYSKPDGETIVDVSKKLYNEIKNSKNGLRYYRWKELELEL